MSFEPGYVARRTNGLAVASMVLGILGLVGLFVIGPILALVFGYLGKGQVDRSGGTEDGRGLAVAGIVLGWVGVGLHLLFMGLFLTLSADSHQVVVHSVHVVRLHRLGS